MERSYTMNNISTFNNPAFGSVRAVSFVKKFLS